MADPRLAPVRRGVGAPFRLVGRSPLPGRPRASSAALVLLAGRGCSEGPSAHWVLSQALRREDRQRRLPRADNGDCETDDRDRGLRHTQLLPP